MIKTEEILKRVDKKHISTVLKKNFLEEKMDKFFDVQNNFEFTGNEMHLDASNSIKINFKSESIQLGYQLLLIFELSEEEQFNHKLQTDFQKLIDNNIDKIVIWSVKRLPPETLQSLKTLNINVIYFSKKDIEDVELITHFFPIKSSDYTYPVILNKLCNLLVKRLKKLFHIVLSEIAAPTYDDEYGKDANIGTKSIMEFEEKVLNSEIRTYLKNNNLKKGSIAIDVGCGTGRHSFVIANLFEKIYGFDFSPGMIKRANKIKKENKIENITFSVADLEYEDIYYENEFKGKVDFIIASFGMGSFIEDTARIFRRYNEWLKPGGKILLSFYNENSIILKITPNWRDTSLAGHIDTENNTLQVKLSEDIIFQIYCKPFSLNIKSMAEAVFDIDKIYTYPTTMALLPNSLLKNKTAFNIFSRIDEKIANDPEYNSGHYVLLTAIKNTNNGGLDKHKVVRKIIKQKKLNHKFISHDFVLSVDDVKRNLGIIEDERMIKTIILNEKQNKRFIAIVLSSDKRVNTSQILNILNDNYISNGLKRVAKNNLKLATEKEILKLGFPIGGIAPFGFNPDFDVLKFIDKRLENIREGKIFTGAGNNVSTLELPIASFKSLTEEYIKIELE